MNTKLASQSKLETALELLHQAQDLVQQELAVQRAGIKQAEAEFEAAKNGGPEYVGLLPFVYEEFEKDLLEMSDILETATDSLGNLV